MMDDKSQKIKYDTMFVIRRHFTLIPVFNGLYN